MRSRAQTVSSRGRLRRGFCFSAVLALISCVFTLAEFGFSTDREKSVTWKPIKEALLRVNDQPVKNWNVYEENKKGDPLLLEIGDRFLLVEIHDRKVFDLATPKIEHKGAELLWDPAALPTEPLATSDWLIKDVGFAYRIDFQLLAEKRLVDLQLPHPMDLRYL